MTLRDKLTICANYGGYLRPLEAKALLAALDVVEAYRELGARAIRYPSEDEAVLNFIDATNWVDATRAHAAFDNAVSKLTGE